MGVGSSLSSPEQTQRALEAVHQGKGQQLHIRITVLWSPVGKSQDLQSP